MNPGRMQAYTFVHTFTITHTLSMHAGTHTHSHPHHRLIKTQTHIMCAFVCSCTCLWHRAHAFILLVLTAAAPHCRSGGQLQGSSPGTNIDASGPLDAVMPNITAGAAPQAASNSSLATLTSDLKVAALASNSSPQAAALASNSSPAAVALRPPPAALASTSSPVGVVPPSGSATSRGLPPAAPLQEGATATAGR